MDFQVVVPVRSALLVPKANRVSELMGHDVLVLASIANGQPGLTTLHLTNLAPATVEKSGRNTNIVLILGCRHKLNYHL